jgi:hypothetical protein
MQDFPTAQLQSHLALVVRVHSMCERQSPVQREFSHVFDVAAEACPFDLASFWNTHPKMPPAGAIRYLQMLKIELQPTKLTVRALPDLLLHLTHMHGAAQTRAGVWPH